MKLTDIIVTLPKGNLFHLDEKILATEEDRITWWDMKREPKSLNTNDKVFLVCGGFVHGYFTIIKTRHNYDYTAAYAAPKISIFDQPYYDIPIEDDIEFRIFFDEWFSIKLIKMKGFQGFRYRTFDYKKTT